MKPDSNDKQHFTTAELVEALDRDRDRLGQALHDSLCQNLGALALLGQSLHRALEREQVSAPLQAQAENLGQLIRQSLLRLHDLTGSLRQPGREEQTIVEALQSAVERVARDQPCELHLSGEPEVLHPDLIFQLSRITQAALENARRHARATQIAVSLVFASPGISIVVTDDGQGCGPVDFSDLTSGWGIMRLRAQLIGARLNVAERIEGGTVVSCSLPL